MELKSKHVEYYEVDYDDLDKFINFHFFDNEDKFCFVADEEANNDSSYTYNVDGEVGGYGREKISNNETMYMTRTYLDEACRLGLIPPGNYLIEVCW